MDSVLQEQIDRLARSAADLFEEIDLATEEGVPIEDIEGAKTQAADLLIHYERLLSSINEKDRVNFRSELGAVVDRIKEKLTHLKEAPE